MRQDNAALGKIIWLRAVSYRRLLRTVNGIGSIGSTARLRLVSYLSSTYYSRIDSTETTGRCADPLAARHPGTQRRKGERAPVANPTPPRFRIRLCPGDRSRSNAVPTDLARMVPFRSAAGSSLPAALQNERRTCSIPPMCLIVWGCRVGEGTRRHASTAEETGQEKRDRGEPRSL